jgi:hypothetical protein
MAAPNPSIIATSSSVAPRESSATGKEEAVCEDVFVADKAYVDCLVANRGLFEPSLGLTIKGKNAVIWYKVAFEVIVYKRKIRRVCAQIEKCSKRVIPGGYIRDRFRKYEAPTLQKALDGLRMETIHSSEKYEKEWAFDEEWQKEMFYNFDLREMVFYDSFPSPTKANAHNMRTKPVAKLSDFYPPSGKQCKRKREADGQEEGRSISHGGTGRRGIPVVYSGPVVKYNQ